VKSVEEWEDEITLAALRFPGVREIVRVDSHPSAIKVRVTLSPEVFVQIYVNVATDTRNMALIVSGQWRYARDCQFCRNWHRHPFDQPDEHDIGPTGGQPMDIEEFLEKVQELVEREELL
jgi:hypothetical protein